MINLSSAFKSGETLHYSAHSFLIKEVTEIGMIVTSTTPLNGVKPYETVDFKGSQFSVRAVAGNTLVCDLIGASYKESRQLAEV